MRITGNGLRRTASGHVMKKARFEEAGFSELPEAKNACVNDAYCTPWLVRNSS
jgi:hypothetical protein